MDRVRRKDLSGVGVLAIGHMERMMYAWLNKREKRLCEFMHYRQNKPYMGRWIKVAIILVLMTFIL